ncbi:MAG: homocysteine S-methyltransferase family protein [Clostridia bacterium]|nr:homocysteine S-methyltransferase family protein [Clostridia bacterium]
MKNNILDILGKKIIFFDGALGTRIQGKGLKLGEIPEIFNIKNPDVVREIHAEYKAAGADVITTNTFGANRLKLKNSGFGINEIIPAAVKIAKKAAGEDGFVALDVGPIGELLAPMGTLSFDEAYEIFAEQMILGEKCGTDLILIETMTDLAEIRVALLAAKENTNLPVFCSMSFEENGHTFTGCSVESMAATLIPFADAIGINCSLGPKEILPLAQKLAKVSKKPIILQPNAGLPRIEDGKTVFDVTPEDYAEQMCEFYKLGAAVMGGCCGTTPEHIKKMTELLSDKNVVYRTIIPQTVVCSPSKTVVVDSTRVIGERINPTGKKKFKEALYNNDIDYILRQGIEQAEAGAEILDVNVGLPDIDEVGMMQHVVSQLQSVTDLPLQIDSSNAEVIECGLRTYTGKAIVNSVNGEQKVLDKILPLIAKYGACVVGLTLDENGIPKKAEERFKIAEKIVNEAEKRGIPKEDIIIDCLTLTVSAQQEDAAETLKAVRMVKEKLGVKTILGVSNISFGLPRRDIINEIFLAQALANGLDLPIINPNSEGMMKVVDAHRVLANVDKLAENYIEKYANTTAGEVSVSGTNEKSSETKTDGLVDVVIKGLKDEARVATEELLKNNDELTVVNDYLIPALDIVGERYEKGTIFLPQLISAAETVKVSFDVLKGRLSGSNAKISKGTIVLATVKGDIHDIGKNIVKVILENYGFSIIDLGRDVAAEIISDCVKENNVKLLGLSALMTTTVKSMEETIKLVKEVSPDTKIMVGGAVLTEEYAKSINADFYAKDAKVSAEIAKKIFE